ncbi:hypothetical protein [Thiocapsa marina]|uniref:Glycosyltransferase RgtA/B/C/D-like domain-containing protein n=1 Tax=Thiocapsa marina 5811 TaxID=768671 RepID=F9U6Z0_9GAMM|nr:hypothetical protein [Thiocapsa marina]EGV20016.1 hypothetical protein ThimaDRAFT_0692 [Thiocapsa marina 5811]
MMQNENTISSSGELESRPDDSPANGASVKWSLISLEGLTLIAIVSLILWSVYPLTEEWGMFSAFDAYGIRYFGTWITSFPARPLHPTGYYLQWLLGNGEVVGVAMATACLAVARYFVARWAVSPLCGGYSRWVISTIAGALPLWPGAWYGRFAAAQVTAVLFLAILGFAIRQLRSRSVFLAFSSAVTVCVLLCIYQALALVLIFLPIASFFWIPSNSLEKRSANFKLLHAQRIGLPIFAGFALYSAYVLIAYLLAGHLGSEGMALSLAPDLLSVQGITAAIEACLKTAWRYNIFTFPVLLLFAFLLFSGSILNHREIAPSLIALSITAVAIFLLPLSAVVFLGSKLNDIDRVLFPVSIGYLLVVLTLMSSLRSRRPADLDRFHASAVVSAIVIISSLFAVEAHRYKEIEQSVLRQALAVVELSNKHNVLIKDHTGFLGDVYTFLNPILEGAMQHSGENVSATICTPANVDRLHSVARRFPVPTTERCQDIGGPGGETLILSARLDKNGEIILVDK